MARRRIGWQARILAALPSDLPQKERGWIESRLRDYEPQIDKAVTHLEKLWRKEDRAADDPLKVEREPFVSVMLVVLLRYCYSVAHEEKCRPMIEKPESTNLAKNAKKARQLALFIRQYEKSRRGVDVGPVSVEDGEEPLLVLSGAELSEALESLARQLEDEGNKEKNRTRFSHVAYRNPPGKGDRPDYRKWRLVGELTSLFQKLFNDKRPSLTAVFSEIAFGVTDSKENILEMHRRMKERGVGIVAIPNVPLHPRPRGG